METRAKRTNEGKAGSLGRKKKNQSVREKQTSTLLIYPSIRQIVFATSNNQIF